ncbi:methionyl-tRNA formyltransferase [Novispirillum sp. DQ9]|uniref:methionyl-tRNA formyltransferase n=1 Tax=Novispirillum sp. DQ9 TaxID=3398612 RepID=UPI003C7D9B53
MRVVFMGTPDFSVPILDALAARHQVVASYSQPPRPAGRGQQDRPCPVQVKAEALGIPVRTPVSLRDAEAQAALAALEPDVAVVAAYGLILPQAVLDIPRLGCINVHASLLPRWRGAAPIQRAIMEGDAETGVTIMRMEAGLDTGPMLLKDRLALTERTTAGALHDALSEMGARLIVEALERLEAGTLPDQPQPAEGVTYAAKIDKAEARIDWTRPAAAIVRHIHGLAPFPGAWCEIHGQRVKVLEAERVPTCCGAPGEIVDDRLTVACGDGAGVRLLRLQRAGKGALDTDTFLRGLPVEAGTALA